MALPIWQRTITDNQGNVIPGAEVEVVLESTGLAADIFSNRDGSTPLTNPFFTGANGFAQFYAAPGEYRITATGPTGSITWRWNVLTGDAALMTNNTGGATLGTVAALNTGTGAAQVPTNGDLGTMSTQDANSVNISGGAISSTNVTGGTVNATTLQQGGSQAYVRSNILGTVSQSAGVPTGAIIERGSNSAGVYTKYADGTGINIVSANLNVFSSNRIMNINIPAALTLIANDNLRSIPLGSTVDGDYSNMTISELRQIVHPIQSSNGAQVGFRYQGTLSSNASMVCRILQIGNWY